MDDQVESNKVRRLYLIGGIAALLILLVGGYFLWHAIYHQHNPKPTTQHKTSQQVTKSLAQTPESQPAPATPTPTTTSTTPAVSVSTSQSNLSNTGPGSVIGWFIGSILVGTVLYEAYLRYRYAKN